MLDDTERCDDEPMLAAIPVAVAVLGVPFGPVIATSAKSRAAYIILMSLRLLITFVFAQRGIISGITSGAVK